MRQATPPVAGIYAIRQRGTERYYVGQTTDVEKRWADHRTALHGGRHHSRFLQRAWNKAGEDAFEWLILHVANDTDDLTALEQWYMDTLPSVFNARPAADSMRGFRHPPEAIEKMSASARKRGQSPAMLAYYERLPEMMRGPHPERGPAISAAKKGRGKGVPWSPARRAAHEARTEPSEKQRAEYARRAGRRPPPGTRDKQRASLQRIVSARGRLGAIVKYDALTPEELIAHLTAHLARLDELEAAGTLSVNRKEIGRRKRRRAVFVARIESLRASIDSAQPSSDAH